MFERRPVKSPYGPLYRLNAKPDVIVEDETVVMDFGYEEVSGGLDIKQIQIGLNTLHLDTLHRWGLDFIGVKKNGTGDRLNDYMVVYMDDPMRHGDPTVKSDYSAIPDFIKVKYKSIGSNRIRVYVYQKSKEGHWGHTPVYQQDRNIKLGRT